jgi:hypothetical protein
MTGSGEPNLSGTKVYPNPADLELRVISPDEMKEIQLMNTLGQTVMTTRPLSKQAVLDIGTLSPGVYLLRIITDGGDQVIRVMVE